MPVRNVLALSYSPAIGSSANHPDARSDQQAKQTKQRQRVVQISQPDSGGQWQRKL